MEVTKTNFKEVLETLPQVFKNAQFITFDTEFTGLKVEGASQVNYFDTLEDLYSVDRTKAETFLAIQYGIVAFQYHEKENKYTYNAYNFYVYPSALCPNVNFTCQASSIDFLVKHNFDFNKLFSLGIPYLRDEEVEKLLKRLEEKYEKKTALEGTPKSLLIIPDEHKSTIDSILSKIDNYIDSKTDESLTIEKYNSFVRRLIYQTTQEKYGADIFVQTNKDETMTIKAGLSLHQMKEIQKEKQKLEKQEILDNVGFSKVIKLIIESGKLFIGHNCFLDLLFTVKQFVRSLPDTYEEFKDLAHFLFPKLLDTKYFACNPEFKIKDSTLYNLLNHFQKSSDIPKVNVAENGCGYTLNEERLHEAAYDAYVTGLCFLGMSNQIGKLNTTNIFKTLPYSPLLEDVTNKFYVPRLCGIQFMNLGGNDVEPDRLNVFHLTFPKEWKRDDIQKLFKDYNNLNISWINDTSAYIGVKKDQNKKVQKQLMKANAVYKLQTYEEFRSSRRVKLTNESSTIDNEDVLSRFKNGSSNSRSSSNGSDLSSNSASSNSSEKKRATQEDIGEITSRPQKKTRPDLRNAV